MRLLIVDDSALMRTQLSAMFAQTGDYRIALARNGAEAVRMNREFQPDVVTLDINMPELDGLSALAQMMVERPVPVIMLSSLTEQGALATFEALNLGALDYVPKPGGTITLTLDRVRAELLAKVAAAARAKACRGNAARPAPSAQRSPHPLHQRAEPARMDDSAVQPLSAAQRRDGIVIIAASTGGPRTLERVLSALPADFPQPVVVAQHMPAAFTAPFATRLDQLCALNVIEASQPTVLEAGKVYICKGGADGIITTRAGRPTLLSRPADPQHLWHPSAALLASSTLAHYPASAITAVMLTGMGDDGADVFTAIARGGGRTIAESEQSAVVFGMPAELIRRDGASAVLAADKVAPQLLQWIAHSHAH